MVVGEDELSAPNRGFRSVIRVGKLGVESLEFSVKRIRPVFVSLSGEVEIVEPAIDSHERVGPALGNTFLAPSVMEVRDGLC